MLALICFCISTSEHKTAIKFNNKTDYRKTNEKTGINLTIASWNIKRGLIKRELEITKLLEESAHHQLLPLLRDVALVDLAHGLPYHSVHLTWVRVDGVGF